MSTNHTAACPRVRGTARNLLAVSRPVLSVARYAERRGADM